MMYLPEDCISSIDSGFFPFLRSYSSNTPDPYRFCRICAVFSSRFPGEFPHLLLDDDSALFQRLGRLNNHRTQYTHLPGSSSQYFSALHHRSHPLHRTGSDAAYTIPTSQQIYSYICACSGYGLHKTEDAKTITILSRLGRPGPLSFPLTERSGRTATEEDVGHCRQKRRHLPCQVVNAFV